MAMAWATVIAVVCVLLSVKYFLRRLRIHGYKDGYVLVTGCDTGFGNLLAKRLDGMGIHVIAGCLTEAGRTELKRICSDKLLAIKLDITKTTNIENALREVTQILPPNKGLWALVNNAGIGGNLGMIEWLRKSDFEKVMEVNLYGHIEMTRIFLPLLRMCGGRIVTVTSIGGRVSSPLASPYSVPKFALEGFLDGIRVQLHSSNVSVHIIEPGLHGTPIVDGAEHGLHEGFRNASRDIQEFYGEEFLEEAISSHRMTAKRMKQNPENVVDAYVHAVTARFPRYRYVVGWDAHLLWLLTFLPERFGDLVFNMFMPKTKVASRKKA